MGYSDKVEGKGKKGGFAAKEDKFAGNASDLALVKKYFRGVNTTPDPHPERGKVILEPVLTDFAKFTDEGKEKLPEAVQVLASVMNKNGIPIEFGIRQDGKEIADHPTGREDAFYIQSSNKNDITKINRLLGPQVSLAV